jgi:hypothetical protein
MSREHIKDRPGNRQGGIGPVLLLVALAAGWIFDGGLSCARAAPPPSLKGLKAPVSPSFDINRIELYFPNRRAEITVERNAPRLKAFANIRFSGSGILQGYWQVNGWTVGLVNQQVFAGQTLTLATPDVPALPTSDTGNHLVQFVITNPKTLIPLPTAIYFVKAKDYHASPLPLALRSPKNKARLDYEQQVLQWEETRGAALYLVEFYRQEKGSGPIFSAYARTPGYELPETCFAKIFIKGGTYYWKVKSFDNKGLEVGESPTWSFTFGD